jgi:hypothetical protein
MDFGEDDPTILDGTPLAEDDANVTPVELPRCSECGALVFIDDFDRQSLASFPPDHCMRARNGSWHWCPNFKKGFGKLVQLIPVAG